MKILFKIFAFVLLTGALNAQSLQISWDKTYGTGGFETIHQIIQSTNGLVIAVGETSGSTLGGKDGLLVVTDFSTGNEIFKKNFGGKKDDVFEGVIQTFDGYFLIAGWTESNSVAKKDAWVLKINPEGKVVWEKKFGGPGNEGWQGIEMNAKGEISLAGFSDKSIWLASLDEKDLKNEKKIGEKEYDSLTGTASTSDGGIILVGNTRKSKKRQAGDIWVTKFDSKNQLEWERFFGERDYEEATDIIATSGGGFAISGLTRSKGEGDLDMWLIKIGREGFQQWDKTFGGKDADIANSVCQLFDGSFLIVGSTKSHRSGARQTKGFAVKTDAGGYRQWQQEYGGEKEDYFTAVCSLFDGNSVLGGHIESKRKGSGKAWMAQLTDASNSPDYLSGIRDIAKIKLENIKVETHDGILRPDDVTYISATVSNPTDIPLRNVKVQVDKVSGSSDVTVWNTNLVGAVAPKSSKIIRIPVKGAKGMLTESHQLNLNISSGNSTLGGESMVLETKQPLAAKVELAAFDFVKSRNSDEITLEISLENTGDFPTKTIDVQFTTPEGFTPKSDLKLQLGAFLPRSKKSTKLVFIKKSGAPEKADFGLVVNESGTEKIRKTFEFGGGGSALAEGPILIWTDPAPHELGTSRINRSEDFIEFKMTVVAGNQLDPSDFQLQVNGSEMEGSKFNEEDLSPPVKKNSQFTYTYKNKIKLKRGVNKLAVMVDGKPSQTLEVVFEPRRANLHILAIGPTHPDLKYTGKDAEDFANSFKDQGGAEKLYAGVFVNKFNLPEQTTLTGIQQAFYDIVYQYKDQLITPNDVLMVFISSHGKVTDNRFKILQSNYNPKYGQISVDFKKDIIESLNQIDCKKLVFLDACHSGAAKSKSSLTGLSEAVIDLAVAQPGISTLTSCRSTELSYEDEAWKNGAFTEAILEAFSGEEITDDFGTFKADANDDQIIRLGELYDYLQVRVPSLVKNQLPSAPTTQVPFMPEEQLDRNLPIYYIQK